MQNSIKTVALIVLLTGLFIFVGHLIGGGRGMAFALVFSIATNAVMYWFSDKIVLRMHRAQPIGPGHPSRVHEMVEEIAMRAGLPMPRVFMIPEAVPNAFATGRDPAHAAVAVTEGITRLLGPRELKGVLAHEMSHVKNRDTLTQMVVASIASAIMNLANMARWFAFFGGRDGDDRDGPNPLVFILIIVLAPIAALLVQMWISRTREYEADASAAQLTADPESLASALESISNPALLQRIAQAGAMPHTSPALNHMYIVNNFSGQSFMTLFSTHPPMQERVRRLRAMIGIRS